jgi:hypothetical protein
MLCWAAIAFLALCVDVAGAADLAIKHFDIPTNPAEKSLKMFAAQSGRGVLFATELVTKVTTNPVKGDLSPTEAMNRLLDGTGFSAVQDGKTGTFTISRSPTRPGEHDTEIAKKKIP